MKLREALQKALVIFDWLERRTIYQDAQVKDAHDAVRAALAEPVADEPVARVELMMTGGNVGLATRIVEIYDHLRESLRPGQLLYTRPAAAPAERGEVVVTKNESGQIVAVTRQDSEGRILSVVAESDADRAQRVPLLQREIFDLWDDARFAEGSSVENFARAIERAHGIGAKP